MEAFRVGSIELRETAGWTGKPYWEVVRWCHRDSDGMDYCYTLSTFGEDGDVVSVGSRPFDLPEDEWWIYKYVVGYWFNDH